jgi:hypothetical protein
MKKHLLFLSFILAMATSMAQDTITGFTFPTTSGPDSLNANLGTSQNQGYDLRFQLKLTPTSDSTINMIYFEDGFTDFAAAADDWEFGAGSKFWSVKFKAADYSNFKVSSRQRSNENGPRDFKLQWRLSATEWADVPSGAFPVGDDWTTGVVTNLPVPITGQGTGSIYIIWLMNSDISVSGAPVSMGGASMIDDIIVTGVSSLGTEEVVFTNPISLYPSPNQGAFRVKSTQPVSSMAIFNEAGQTVYSVRQPSQETSIDLTGAAKGTYFLQVLFTDSDKPFTRSFTIR